MKIATWNLMRPNAGTISRNVLFHKTIKECDADILILTETNSIINPGPEYFSITSTELPEKFETFNYKKGENRVTIFSKYPFGKQYNTVDHYTSVCIEVITPFGPLIIYGTIIGVTGGSDMRFAKDFEEQKADILKFAKYGNLCVAGDYNVFFSGYSYPSRKTITEAENFFKTVDLDILTKEIADSPDHISISSSFINNIDAIAFDQKFDKKLTDHSLVSVICKSNIS